MTSLNVAVSPVGNSSSKSSPRIKHSSIRSNPTGVGSILVGQVSSSGHASVVGACGCCANTPIQHASVGSCLIQDEIPGETTTE